MALTVIGQNLGILGILGLIIGQWYQQKSDLGKSKKDYKSSNIIMNIILSN